MKVATAVFALTVCCWAGLLAADDPPLRDELTYAIHPGGMVTYEVTICPAACGGRHSTDCLSAQLDQKRSSKLRDVDAQVARNLTAAADDPFRVITP